MEYGLFFQKELFITNGFFSVVRGFESRVASPVQVFLDCMEMKGRGEEMAETVFSKEIRK